MDYKNLQIDMSNLHFEWLKQPMLREYWGRAHTEASNERDHCKKKLEEIKAELDIMYRTEWDNLFPNLKMTEGGIANIIANSGEYKETYSEYLETIKNTNILSNVLKVLDDRKSALDNQVKLFIAGYFDASNISEETKQFIQEKNKEALVDDLNKNERMKKIRKKRSS